MDIQLLFDNQITPTTVLRGSPILKSVLDNPTLTIYRIQAFDRSENSVLNNPTLTIYRTSVFGRVHRRGADLLAARAVHRRLPAQVPAELRRRSAEVIHTILIGLRAHLTIDRYFASNWPTWPTIVTYSNPGTTVTAQINRRL